MPVTFTVLDSGGTDTDARDFTTANDITPKANTLHIAAIMVLDLGGARTASTLTGCNLTWSIINGAAGGATEPGIRVFKGVGSSPTTGKLTFAETVSSGQTADGAAWVIFECSGADAGIASLGVIQQNTGSTTTDSLSITLGAFRDANSATVGVFGGYDTAGGALDITVGSGFNQLSDFSQAAGGDTLRLFVETLGSNDTSVDCSISTANDRLSGVAFEVGHRIETVIATSASLPAAGVSVEATPAVIATTAALPAAGVGVGAAPAVIATAATVPDVGVSVEAAPAVVSTVADVPAVTVDAEQTVEDDVVRVVGGGDAKTIIGLNPRPPPERMRASERQFEELVIVSAVAAVLVERP